MAGGVCGRGACVAEGGGMHGRAGVHGGSWRGAVCTAGKMATEVDGTHPTGMLSCLSGIFDILFCCEMYSMPFLVGALTACQR